VTARTPVNPPSMMSRCIQGRAHGFGSMPHTEVGLPPTPRQRTKSMRCSVLLNQVAGGNICGGQLRGFA